MATFVPKLYYWGIPGRAESIRLTFHVGQVPFEDIVVKGPEYADLKEKLTPTVPQINLPLLEVGDKYFSESKAIMRYAGAVNNLIPADPLGQLRVDEAICLTDDIINAFAPTFSIKDPEEKVKARLALCQGDGKLVQVMNKIDSYLKCNCVDDGFLCGPDLTVGDISMWCALNNLVCGFLDGIPLDFLDQFPVISAYRKKVGTLPAVASRYADINEGPLSVSFKF
eukprot:CAMPEP_0174960940 /NCGR_PEP_ID=MMETSP0004_2-20121128/3968_1 /TAXON_ID=420556 /ORGANISM="Ochromonas sp., Strain CCMP1393" /LENGTH=224 /DNA_ID=CAMNT_0016209339 /DNA_START=35 /DNA_END=709 /DNA_ORIENTATION=-